MAVLAIARSRGGRQCFFGLTSYNSRFPHLEMTGGMTGESVGPGECRKYGQLEQAVTRQKKRNNWPGRADSTRSRRINRQHGSLVNRPTFSPIYLPKWSKCSYFIFYFLVGLINSDKSWKARGELVGGLNPTGNNNLKIAVNSFDNIAVARAQIDNIDTRK